MVIFRYSRMRRASGTIPALVGSPVVEEIVAHWEKYADTIPNST
jgi:purine nucleoside permease